MSIHRSLACGLGLVALFAVPASADQRLVAERDLRDLPNPAVAYVAPNATGPVVALLDEEVGPLLPLLTNDGGDGDSSTIALEECDVFAGVEAIRVTPFQRFRGHIPGWSFRIVEKPA